jgi:hypothetical protein
MSSLLSKLNKQRWRYDAAIEALQELVEQDNEIEPVKSMITYLKEKKQKVFAQWKEQNDINDIQVRDVQQVSHLQ